MKSRTLAVVFGACLLSASAFAGDIQYKAEPLIITAIPMLPVLGQLFFPKEYLSTLLLSPVQ